jgi:ribosomal protein S27AE
MSKTLKTLEEFNTQRRSGYRFPDSTPKPNGIACPKCGEELVDSQPNVTLTSMPPQKNIHCPKCDYTGFRVA